MIRYYRSVHALEAESWLRAGWMTALPVHPHPVADAYERVTLVWLCECEPRSCDDENHQRH
jgi:hypothetical protein